MRVTSIVAASALAWSYASAQRDPSIPTYEFTFSLNGRDGTPEYARTYVYHNPKTGARNILANGTLPHPEKGGSGLEVQLEVVDPDDNPEDTGDHYAHVFSPGQSQELGLLKYRCKGYTDTKPCFIELSNDPEDSTNYWFRDHTNNHLTNHGNKPTTFFNCEYQLGNKKVQAVGYGKLQRKGGKLVAPDGCKMTWLYALPQQK